MRTSIELPWRFAASLALAVAAATLLRGAPRVEQAPPVAAPQAPPLVASQALPSAMIETPATPASSPELAFTSYEAKLDATHAYWIRSMPGPLPRTELVRAPLAGGAPEQIAEDVTKFVLHGDYIYYATYFDERPFSKGRRGTSPPPASIHRVERSGGAKSFIAVAPLEPVEIAVGGGYVYWITSYWLPDNGVHRASIDDCCDTITLRAGTNLERIGADNDYLYVVGNGALQRIAHGETRAVKLANVGEPSLLGELVSGPDAVYVSASGKLLAVPRAGGTPRTIASDDTAHGEIFGSRLTSFNGILYWTTNHLHCAPSRIGMVRRIDPVRSTVDVIATGCSLRGVLIGPTASFVVEKNDDSNGEDFRRAATKLR